jgi:hypothetical protein
VKALAAACLAATVLSCSGQTTVTRRTVVAAPPGTSAWTGRTVEDVERVFGAASETEADGEGGTVLVFRQNTPFSVSQTAGAPPQGTRGALADPERTQSETITKVIARFWIDANGTVYRHWFAPEVYDSDRDEPPPREPSGEEPGEP